MRPAGRQRTISGSPPRVWGRRCDRASATAIADGSPPRVWGRLRSGILTWHVCRFTPTCVGTTIVPCAMTLRTTSVHPHVRGEDVSMRIVQLDVDRGSPPRVWGRLYVESPSSGAYGSPPRVWGRPASQRASQCCRFTPTCVGKTQAAWQSRLPPSVHPHVCGEDAYRGLRQLRRCRFTPTCVGTTHESRSVLAIQTVHPHVCGDDVPSRGQYPRRSGSPPRVWGQRDWRAPCRVVIDGSPPRVWGRRQRERRTSCAIAVHPHVCGDDVRAQSSLDASRTVHPHVCGDDVHVERAQRRASTGSPPRVWGKRRSAAGDRWR